MKLVTIRGAIERTVCESGDVGWDYRYYQTHLKGTESVWPTRLRLHPRTGGCHRPRELPRFHPFLTVYSPPGDATGRERTITWRRWSYEL